MFHVWQEGRQRVNASGERLEVPLLPVLSLEPTYSLPEPQALEAASLP